MKSQKYERKYAWFEGDTKRIAAVIKMSYPDHVITICLHLPLTSWHKDKRV